MTLPGPESALAWRVRWAFAPSAQLSQARLSAARAAGLRQRAPRHRRSPGPQPELPARAIFPEGSLAAPGVGAPALQPRPALGRALQPQVPVRPALPRGLRPPRCRPRVARPLSRARGIAAPPRLLGPLPPDPVSPSSRDGGQLRGRAASPRPRRAAASAFPGTRASEGVPSPPPGWPPTALKCCPPHTHHARALRRLGRGDSWPPVLGRRTVLPSGLPPPRAPRCASAAAEPVFSDAGRLRAAPRPRSHSPPYPVLFPPGRGGHWAPPHSLSCRRGSGGRGDRRISAFSRPGRSGQRNSSAPLLGPNPDA